LERRQVVEQLIHCLVEIVACTLVPDREVIPEQLALSGLAGCVSPLLGEANGTITDGLFGDLDVIGSRCHGLRHHPGKVELPRFPTTSTATGQAPTPRVTSHPSALLPLRRWKL
jgi:hypothetical protein